MNTTSILDQPFVAPPTTGQQTNQTKRKGWQRLQGVLRCVQHKVESFERDRLDPLFERIIVWWGDRRHEQRRQVRTTTLVDQLSQGVSNEDRQLNRSFYICAGSLTIAVVGRLVYPPLQLLSLPGMCYGAWQLYQQAFVTIRHERRLDVNVLMALVNTAFIGGGYWVLGNLNNTSYFFNRRLLKVVKARLQDDLITVLTQQPRLVWTVVDGQEVQRPLAQVQAGDVVLVHAGQVVPVDGVICAGEAILDEHMLTGEARPVEKTVGDPVFTATLLVTGKISLTMTQAGAETLVSHIDAVLRQTVDFRSTRQLQMQQLTDQLVPPILGLAAVTAPFLGLNAAAAVVENHPFRQLNTFGALGMLNAFAEAAEQGILIKDGRSLELLEEVDTLVFDKTGTLTLEQPHVAAIHCSEGMLETELLAYAAAAEQHQSHPIARAILAAVAVRGVLTPPIDEATFKVGLGLMVRSNGDILHVGSARFMAQANIPLPPALLALPAAHQDQGQLLVWVARNEEIVGVLELHATLRPEAAAVVTQLRQLRRGRHPRLRTVMILSGDHPAPTEQAALAIGADAWRSEVLPTGKAEWIARLQAEGRKVCFIGDGINDAIALKQAHVSVSLRGATLAAVDTAHVVLLDESLQQLPALFALSQNFKRRQRLMLVPVLGTSLLGLTGIYLWGWGLTAITILDHIGMAGGVGVVMQPQLAAKTR